MDVGPDDRNQGGSGTPPAGEEVHDLRAVDQAEAVVGHHLRLALARPRFSIDVGHAVSPGRSHCAWSGGVRNQ
jgi:hypothetical protein